ncbi:uncharacterized protein LOC113227405 [Hyposmocoma kahamanoa]|uniref:uncharacterized protein LOC113227405 n=1 Tax=Hyposmocoma kahamanoa TaxID=1477025 RepID=UPI000E6D8C09|nr:uncharacterized protein LOC113227405 [Hyposmocoma kahamanoa]
MRLEWLFLSLVAVSVAASVAVVNGQDELPLAAPCNATACDLPNCQCSSTDIPKNLNARNTPQFVTITFNGAVLITNMMTYRRLLYDRSNSNGCNIGTTFFVRHEYTNYQDINELYNRGFEIALNSITHRAPQTYWAEAPYEDLVKEFADQKILISHFANISIDDIKGVRFPFLQTAGDASYQLIKDHDLLYDSTWATVNLQDPGIWPYTLDYASIQDCQVQPCPTASLPGVWVSPLITWRDLQGFPCSSVDACAFVPDLENEQAWFQFFMTNFERHYLGTRAPFDLSVPEGYIASYPAVYRALDRFIEFLTRLPDVFLVNERDVIEWSKNPLDIEEYLEQNCTTVESTVCDEKFCPLTSEHNDITYYMTVCSECPETYPWLGNPLGEAPSSESTESSETTESYETTDSYESTTILSHDSSY